jgi:hypothetical protein
MLSALALGSLFAAALAAVEDSQDEHVVQVALEIAGKVYRQPLLFVCMLSAGAAASDLKAVPMSGPVPDAGVWANLAGLYSHAQQLAVDLDVSQQHGVTTTAILLAACKLQLPGVQVDDVQTVLAGT